jgi:hypothetical protein
MRRIREILRLKNECGLSHRAIAQACGVGLGTVSVQLRRQRPDKAAALGTLKVLGFAKSGKRRNRPVGVGALVARGTPSKSEPL